MEHAKYTQFNARQTIEILITCPNNGTLDKHKIFPNTPSSGLISHSGGWSVLLIKFTTAKAAISCTITSTVTEPAKVTNNSNSNSYTFS